MSKLNKPTRARLLTLLSSILVGALLVAALPQPAAHGVTPTFRQARGKEIGSGTVNSVAFNSANVAGNLIIVQVIWSNTNNVTLSDTRGNTYAAATTRTTWNANWSSQTFYAKNIVAGTNTVTATFATAINSFGIIQVHEYSGIDKANPFDGARATAGSGTAMNSGPITTTNANDLLFGAGASIGAMSAIGAGYQQRLNTAGNKTMDRNVTSVGTYNATATHGGGAWVMHVAAFKADAGTDTTPPSAPAGLTGNAVSSTQINLAWNASTDNVGVTGYQVERCTGTNCTNFSLVATVSGTSRNDTGLAPSTTYRYRVRATDAAGNLSGYSAIATASTPASPDLQAPTAPTGLTAAGASTTQIDLAWTASTDNVAVTGYRIFRDGVHVGTTSGTSFHDTGLTAATTYSYTVSAFDAAGNQSAQTAPVAATTMAPDTQPPSASMTAPAQGSTVSGIVTVSANATDNVAVASVDFLLDGVSIGIDSTAPYSVQWNTTTTSNGPHALSARARDTAGNFGTTSSVINVTVDNTAPPLPPDLMAAWAFNEGSGSTSADISGNGNTTTLVNNPAWVSGKYGTGVKFDKIDDYVRALNSPTLNVSGTALSISVWINPLAGGGDQEVFGKFWNAGMTSPFYQYGLELHGGGQTPVFEVGTTSGLQAVSMGSTLPVGQWSHLAVTFDGSSVRFYVNGNLASSSPLSASLTARDTVLHLGADASTSQHFNGTLDEFRIYKRTMTQAEIQSDMNTPLRSGSDPTAPSVSIQSPIAGAQVTGMVTVTATADDDTGVEGVQFFVDGTVLGLEDSIEPYAATWDTRVVSNGAHTLTARARDTAGHLTVSAPVTVNVANSDFFQNEVLATGFDLPTAIKFLPDGRMLVAELRGKIKVVPPPYTTPDPNLFLQITSLGTLNQVQQGIFDFALDPDYATNHHYYVFYTASTGGHDRDRLSRFTANATSTGTIPGSELVLYEDPGDANHEHHGGGVTFANDGRIFFTTGDHFQGTPSQDLTSPRGKVHRINPDGTVPTDNPFHDGAGPNWDSIWAYGLRNPFRVSYDRPTGRLLIGDVGGNVDSSNEEVNLGARGANYGWPNSEGPCSPPCTSPLYDYEHNGRDASVTGGFVYRGTQFPSSMQGNYFFADYAQNWIRRLTFDGSGNVSGVFNFEPPDDTLDGPTGDVVYLTEGLDGSVYYLDLGYSDVTGTFGVSKVRRIRYVQSNRAPTSIATANMISGPQPLTVNFSSAGSMDPEGQPITFSWDFGDGSTPSTAANPTHVYTQAGQYLVRLTVSDGVNTTFSAPLTISVGSAPTATIASPTDGLTFRAGDVITYSGDATDPDDGTLPASAFAWTVDFLHEGHVHPGVTTTGTKSGTFTVPTSGHDFSGNTRYRITLTVSDSNGLQDTRSVTIWPQKVNLTFDTVPTGLTLHLDGVAKPAPFAYESLIGFHHTIEARDQSVGSNNYGFSSWSDGGAQAHAIVVPATAASYTATYSVLQAPTGLMGAWGFNEGTGTTSADTSGNGNGATLLNGLAWVTGKYGGGLSFDGANDYLTVTNSPSLDISGNAVTLSMWLNPSTTSTGDQVVIAKHWNTTMTSPYYQYGLELQSNGARPVFFVGTPGGVTSAAMTSSLAKGQWSHLAVVFNGSTVQFYVNGALVSTGNLSATITARGNPLRVGSDASTEQFYKGLLDNVRVYNRALSSADVSADMNAAL
jgi:glucose/arabinose dehydrogenase/chitodextrinase